MLLRFPASAFSSSLPLQDRVHLLLPAQVLGVEGFCSRLMLVGDWPRFSYTPPSTPPPPDGQDISYPRLWGLL